MTWVVVIVLVLALTAGYLAAGGVYARSQAVPLYQRYRAEHETKWADSPGIRDRWSALDESHARREVHDGLVVRLLLWPFVAPLDWLRPRFGGWITAPLDKRRARAAQLRADAKSWRDKQRDGTARRDPVPTGPPQVGPLS